MSDHLVPYSAKIVFRQNPPFPWCFLLVIYVRCLHIIPWCKFPLAHAVFRLDPSLSATVKFTLEGSLCQLLMFCKVCHTMLRNHWNSFSLTVAVRTIPAYWRQFHTLIPGTTLYAASYKAVYFVFQWFSWGTLPPSLYLHCGAVLWGPAEALLGDKDYLLQHTIDRRLYLLLGSTVHFLGKLHFSKNPAKSVSPEPLSSISDQLGCLIRILALYHPCLMSDHLPSARSVFGWLWLILLLSSVGCGWSLVSDTSS